MTTFVNGSCDFHGTTNGSDATDTQDGDAKRKREHDANDILEDATDHHDSHNRKLRRVPKRRKLLSTNTQRPAPDSDPHAMPTVPNAIPTVPDAMPTIPDVMPTVPDAMPTLPPQLEQVETRQPPGNERYPAIRPAQHTKLPEANQPDFFPTFPYRHSIRSNICVLEGDMPANSADRSILVSKQMLVPRSVWSEHRHQIIREHFSASLPCYADFPLQATNGPVETVRVSRQDTSRRVIVRLEKVLENLDRNAKKPRFATVKSEELQNDPEMF